MQSIVFNIKFNIKYIKMQTSTRYNSSIHDWLDTMVMIEFPPGACRFTAVKRCFVHVIAVYSSESGSCYSHAA